MDQETLVKLIQAICQLRDESNEVAGMVLLSTLLVGIICGSLLTRWILRGGLRCWICRSLLIGAAMMLIAASTNADVPKPDLQEAVRAGQQSFQKRLTSQTTNAFDVLKALITAYDESHPSDIWLETLSAKRLQKLINERPGDLAPRLLLVPRGLTSDEDCDAWLVNLKKGFKLCTGVEQQATCLALALPTTLNLEGKLFGKPMLTNLALWLKILSPKHPALNEKIQYLQLFTAIATEALSDVTVFAKGTAFQSLTPIWLMSKGKWKSALAETRVAKEQPDLSAEDKRMLDLFESILVDITQKKPDQ